MSPFKILLLSILTIIVSSKDIVLLGDSRFCGIAYSLMGFKYTKVTKYYGTGSNIISSSSKNYAGHNIKVIAEVGASYNSFSKSDLPNGVKKILGNSKSGTIVLLWLGVNNLNSGSTFDYYKKLALQYKNLKFYAISVTGVVQSIEKSISNEAIKRFNIDLKNKIQSSKISNLRYKSILNKENPTQINNGGKIVNVNASYSSDGLHYNAALYRIIFSAMTSGLK
jgi:hypothetical protein